MRTCASCSFFDVGLGECKALCCSLNHWDPHVADGFELSFIADKRPEERVSINDPEVFGCNHWIVKQDAVHGPPEPPKPLPKDFREMTKELLRIYAHRFPKSRRKRG